MKLVFPVWELAIVCRRKYRPHTASLAIFISFQNLNTFLHVYCLFIYAWYLRGWISSRLIPTSGVKRSSYRLRTFVPHYFDQTFSRAMHRVKWIVFGYITYLSMTIKDMGTWRAHIPSGPRPSPSALPAHRPKVMHGSLRIFGNLARSIGKAHRQCTA